MELQAPLRDHILSNHPLKSASFTSDLSKFVVRSLPSIKGESKNNPLQIVFIFQQCVRIFALHFGILCKSDIYT